MHDWLFYEPAAEPPTPVGDLEDALAALGAELDGAPGAAYRPGCWRDPATGAWTLFDLGEPPLEGDELHPPTAYPGWRPLPLVAHLPLGCPHWVAVEGLAFLERLIARLPQVHALDCEDTRAEEDGEPGPFAFQRARALLSWERQHSAQVAGDSRLARMDRRASVALWRYRRERAAGAAARPDLRWPEALALLEDGAARSAALWEDPTRPLALPPVELVVVPRADGAGVLPADEVLAAAGGGETLPHGLARAVPGGGRLADLHARAHLLPAQRFRALGDGDWTD